MTTLINVYINKCGPVTDSSIEIPIPGIIVFIGPNLTGKSLLGGAITSYFFTNCILQSEKIIKELEVNDPLELALDLISEYDPLDLSSSREALPEGATIAELGKHGVLAETYKILRPEDRLVKYLTTILYTAEMGEILNLGAVNVEEIKNLLFSRAPKGAIELDVHINQIQTIKTTLPLSFDKLSETRVELNKNLKEYIGIKNISPYTLYLSLVSQISTPLVPSLKLLRELTRNRTILSSSHTLNLNKIFRELIAYSELTGVTNFPEDKIKRKVDEIAEKLVLFNKKGEMILKVALLEVFQELFSKGLRTLLSHYLLVASSLYLARIIELIPIVYLDEPEVSLDTLTTFKLLELYKPILETGGAVILTTHREDLILSYLQRALERKDHVITPNKIRVYEFSPELTDYGIQVRVKKCDVKDVIIKSERVDRILKLIYSE